MFYTKGLNTPLCQLIFMFKLLVVSTLSYGNDFSELENAINALPEGGTLTLNRHYVISRTLNLPNTQITLRGGKISGEAGVTPLIRYPLNVRNIRGQVVTQNIEGIIFDIDGDNTAIELHQTWDSAGKIGPRVSNNTFNITSSTTTTAKAISLKGVWSATISENSFAGRGDGGGPTNNIGGYGIYFNIGYNMNTSVMNTLIVDNSFVTIANPIHMPKRSGYGRIEGIRINSNNFIAGNVAITAHTVLALTVTGNMISDYHTGIYLYGCWSSTITGNSEITAYSAGVHLDGAPDGFLEKLSITGNSISSSNNAIYISNNHLNQGVRIVSITGNNISGHKNGNKTGIKFDGTKSISNMSITGNVLSNLTTGIAFNAAHEKIQYANNTYTYVNKSISNPEYSNTPSIKHYKATHVHWVQGGGTNTQYVLKIAVGIFSKLPESATLSANADALIGIYDPDSSTLTSLVFNIFKIDGGN